MSTNYSGGIMEQEQDSPPPIYWASYKKAPRRNGTWVTGFREFDSEEKRDQFVRNTKYRVTGTGER
jgi:hypothetical protein